MLAASPLVVHLLPTRLVSWLGGDGVRVPLYDSVDSAHHEKEEKLGDESTRRID